MVETLTVADIVGAHGIKGWVKIRPLVEDPATLTRYQRVDALPGARLKAATPLPNLSVKQVKVQGKGVIAQLEGIDDRNQAEALRGYQLVIAATELPPPGEGEYYWRDLIGLLVWCRDGGDPSKEVLIGRVDYLLETGANDVLVVKATEDSLDDRERLVPWLLDDVIVRVDMAAGAVHVDWPLDV